MRQWTEEEWSYCLTCFYNNELLIDAITQFSKKYTNRTRKAILSKIHKSGVKMEDFLGSGLGSKKLTKRMLIKELRDVYKILGQPFNQKQFNELSSIDVEDVIGYFGRWDTALDESNLKNKFDKFHQISSEIKTFDPENELKKTWQKQKDQLIKQAENRKVKWLREQSNKLEIVSEMIHEAVAKAEPHVVDVVVSNYKPIPKIKSMCTMWFEFSDLQLGTFMTSEEMGGINKHNWIIWTEKLQVWKDEVIKKIHFHKDNYQIDRVILACLGDMVEGQNIFEGQAWKIDRHVVDQAILGANDVSAAWMEIFLTFPDIHFDILEVFGNHGRIGKKGSSPYSCSMDKVFQRMLETQLANVKGMDNYKYHQNEAWFYFVEIYGWHHLLLHGDQGMSKLWSNRPTVNSLEKGLVRYNQMFQQQIHFIHCGHFHNDWQLSFNLSQMLINGSFVGTSPFSATVMVASSPPVQVMHLFDPRVGLAKTERIYLTTDAVRKPIKPKQLLRG